jgi:hydroxypyruvate reductase
MSEGGSDRERLIHSMRAMARQIFLRALDEVAIGKAFGRHVSCDRGVLRIREDLFDLNSLARTVVISVGKAGHTMVEALRDHVGDSLEGIVAAPAPISQVRGLRYFEGGHPVPNAESIRAAEAVLKTLNAQNASSLVIFLLSGGGSSIIEKPIDDEISLDDLIQTYKALVHSGAPIAEINAVRKHLSAVKGGRLAQVAHPAQQVSLLVSDVPDGALDALASGPTLPDPTTVEDCQAVAVKYDLLAQFPASVRELFERHALEETPKSDDPVFCRSRWWPILSNSDVVASAVEEAQRLGFMVEVDNSCDDWDYEFVAEHLVRALRDLRAKYARACLISGGEVTVKVTNGGTGGRNQQLTLAIATRIRGENITVLSAGTDGVDGNSPATGAIADGTTVDRAKARHLDIGRALADFDTYALFEALGDTIVTGPTGNNLRDVRILLSY